MSLPEVHPDREPLTEQEARKLGHAAERLPRLRRMYRDAAGKLGSLTVGTASAFGHNLTIQLGSYDLQAALKVLIEHDELLLASFNVTIERDR